MEVVAAAGAGVALVQGSQLATQAAQASLGFRERYKDAPADLSFTKSQITYFEAFLEKLDNQHSASPAINAQLRPMLDEAFGILKDLKNAAKKYGSGKKLKKRQKAKLALKDLKKMDKLVRKFQDVLFIMDKFEVLWSLDIVTEIRDGLDSRFPRVQASMSIMLTSSPRTSASRPSNEFSRVSDSDHESKIAQPRLELPTTPPLQASAILDASMRIVTSASVASVVDPITLDSGYVMTFDDDMDEHDEFVDALDAFEGRSPLQSATRHTSELHGAESSDFACLSDDGLSWSDMLSLRQALERSRTYMAQVERHCTFGILKTRQIVRPMLELLARVEILLTSASLTLLYQHSTEQATRTVILKYIEEDARMLSVEMASFQSRVAAADQSHAKALNEVVETLATIAKRFAALHAIFRSKSEEEMGPGSKVFDSTAIPKTNFQLLSQQHVHPKRSSDTLKRSNSTTFSALGTYMSLFEKHVSGQRKVAEYKIRSQVPFISMRISLNMKFKGNFDTLSGSLSFQHVVLDQSPLMQSCIDGDLSRAYALIRDGDASHNVVSESGLTPLIGAIQNGHIDIVRFLLQTGADPQEVGGETQNSPLQWAIQSNHLEIIRLLLDSHVDVHYVNLQGWNTLFFCWPERQEGELNERRDVLDVLKLLDATVHDELIQRDNNGITALHRAVTFGSKDDMLFLMRICKRQGLYLQTRDRSLGRELIQHAIKAGNAGTFDALWQHQEFTHDIVDDLGWSLLHSAASRPCKISRGRDSYDATFILRSLLISGCDPYRKTWRTRNIITDGIAEHGSTPGDIARAIGDGFYRAYIVLLVELGLAKEGTEDIFHDAIEDTLVPTENASGFEAAHGTLRHRQRGSSNNFG